MALKRGDGRVIYIYMYTYIYIYIYICIMGLGFKGLGFRVHLVK